jgi:hypothetical protein
MKRNTQPVVLPKKSGPKRAKKDVSGLDKDLTADDILALQEKVRVQEAIKASKKKTHFKSEEDEDGKTTLFLPKFEHRLGRLDRRKNGSKKFRGIQKKTSNKTTI